jgi:hypothetical protein
VQGSARKRQQQQPGAHNLPSLDAHTRRAPTFCLQADHGAGVKPFAAGLAALASAVALMGMPLQADAVSGGSGAFPRSRIRLAAWSARRQVQRKLANRAMGNKSRRASCWSPPSRLQQQQQQQQQVWQPCCQADAL